MAHPSKNKGDRAEREAIGWLLQTAPDLANVPKPQTNKAAGIPEDVGDLWFIQEAAIQVKSYKASALGAAVRDAAAGSQVQATNGGRELGVGMVKVPQARKGQVQWIAACTETTWWPQLPVVAEFRMISKAMSWLRDDSGPYGYRPYPRTERVCLLASGESAPVVLAPFEAWLGGYRLRCASLGDGQSL